MYCYIILKHEKDFKGIYENYQALQDIWRECLEQGDLCGEIKACVIQSKRCGARTRLLLVTVGHCWFRLKCFVRLYRVYWTVFVRLFSVNTRIKAFIR